jgi:hypothetical protein
LSEIGASPPALFLHTAAVYRRMEQEAKEEDVEGMPMLVYEGLITRLVTVDLNLSVPYFSAVRNALLGMRCVIQLKRGGGSAPSRWALIKEPTLDLYEAYSDRVQPTSRVAVLSQQISDLSGRVTAVEETVEALLDAHREG